MLIEREAALKAVHEAIAEGKSWYSALSHLPSAEKTGKWVEEHLITRELVYCSECGFGKSLDDHRPYNYCPNCGASMVNDDE